MTYVVVNAFNPKLSIDILTLKPEDLDARMDKTPLEIVSSEQKYTSRLLVLIEAVRQVRGECGQRQVKDCEIALAHGNGGVLSSQCTVLFGSDATL